MNEENIHPIIDIAEAANVVPRSSIEAALTRWQEQRKQLELSIVATNTVIAELTALLNPPAPEKVPLPPPEDKP